MTKIHPKYLQHMAKLSSVLKKPSKLAGIKSAERTHYLSCRNDEISFVTGDDRVIVSTRCPAIEKTPATWDCQIHARTFNNVPAMFYGKATDLDASDDQLLRLMVDNLHVVIPRYPLVELTKLAEPDEAWTSLEISRVALLDALEFVSLDPSRSTSMHTKDLCRFHEDGTITRYLGGTLIVTKMNGLAIDASLQTTDINQLHKWLAIIGDTPKTKQIKLLKGPQNLQLETDGKTDRIQLPLEFSQVGSYAYKTIPTKNSELTATFPTADVLAFANICRGMMTIKCDLKIQDKELVWNLTTPKQDGELHCAFRVNATEYQSTHKRDVVEFSIAPGELLRALTRVNGKFFDARIYLEDNSLLMSEQEPFTNPVNARQFVRIPFRTHSKTPKTTSLIVTSAI